MKADPLYVRPGARYACYADGLCCTDIHAVGPITEKERTLLSVVSDNVVRMNEILEEWVMTMTPDEGACLFLEEGKCAIHTAMDGVLKPGGCHRFPFGLTKTPRGGRITMEVRCSCQTLMPTDAPAVDTERVAPLLLDEDGELEAAFSVTKDIPMRSGTRVPFAEYEVFEGAFLERIANEGLDAALDRQPFADVGTDWKTVARGMQEEDLRTRFDAALLYVSDAILEAHGVGDPPDRVRAWEPAYRRAEARMPSPIEPKAIYECWASESVWRMHWAARISFEQHRKSLATLLDIARRIASRLEQVGVRKDRAAAEAVTIVETVGTSMWWWCVDERLPDE